MRQYGHIVIAVVLLSTTALAGDYYVATTGNDAAAGTIGAPWLTIGRAAKSPFPFTYRQPGDTVYIRGGLYSGNNNAISLDGQFAIGVSGTPGSPITFKAYPGETVIVCDTLNPYRGVTLQNLSWWTFDGIIYSNCMANLNFVNCSNIVVTNCVFGWFPLGCIATNSTAPAGWDYSSVAFIEASKYNRVMDCLFTNWGFIYSNAAGGYIIAGTHLKFGTSNSTNQGCYNIAERCTFVHGGHDDFELEKDHNIIRNCLFINDGFIPTNDFCHKLVNMGAGGRTNGNPFGLWSPRITKPGAGPAPQLDMRNVFESNRMFYSGPPADSPGGHIIECGTSRAIYRFNSIAYGTCGGICFNISQGDSRSNAVYNNTIYGCDLAYQYNIVTAVQAEGGIGTLQNAYSNHYVVNNIVWRDAYRNIDPSVISYSQCRNNFTNNAIDPLFVSTNGWGHTYTPGNLPDFRIKAGSPCIDAGTWLAYTTNSGSGTTMTVDNSLYFSDGNTMVQGDTIQLQGTTSKAIILSNDWLNNTLYLDTSLTRNSNQGVSLPWTGAAPDIGMDEFQGSRITRAVNARVGRIKSP